MGAFSRRDIKSSHGTTAWFKKVVTGSTKWACLASCFESSHPANDQILQETAHRRIRTPPTKTAVRYYLYLMSCCGRQSGDKARLADSRATLQEHGLPDLVRGWRAKNQRAFGYVFTSDRCDSFQFFTNTEELDLQDSGKYARNHWTGAATPNAERQRNNNRPVSTPALQHQRNQNQDAAATIPIKRVNTAITQGVPEAPAAPGRDSWRSSALARKSQARHSPAPAHAAAHRG